MTDLNALASRHLFPGTRPEALSDTQVLDFPFQALKGLSDPSLADGEPMPDVEVAVERSEVEEWVGSEIRQLARERIGLPGDAS